MAARSRDPALVDTINARELTRFEGVVYRMVRDGRDPTRPGASGGRWDDGTFDVLYTALDAQDAQAEMAFHVSRGQPVVPSKPVNRMYRLSMAVEAVLDLSQRDDLTHLEIDERRFGQLSYAERHREYPRCQDIGEIAHFLGFGGLLVPSARHSGANLVIFYQADALPTVDVAEDLGPVRWSEVDRPTGRR